MSFCRTIPEVVTIAYQTGSWKYDEVYIRKFGTWLETTFV
jgi:hypothetical protein